MFVLSRRMVTIIGTVRISAVWLLAFVATGCGQSGNFSFARPRRQSGHPLTDGLQRMAE